MIPLKVASKRRGVFLVIGLILVLLALSFAGGYLVSRGSQKVASSVEKPEISAKAKIQGQASTLAILYGTYSYETYDQYVLYLKPLLGEQFYAEIFSQEHIAAIKADLLATKASVQTQPANAKTATIVSINGNNATAKLKARQIRHSLSGDTSTDIDIQINYTDTGDKWLASSIVEIAPQDDDDISPAK